MKLLDRYNHLMGNNITLLIFVIISVILVNWWMKKEHEWKQNNSYGLTKKIIKVIGILLIAIFGLPGMLIFFGSI
jgi:hypothetical protein